MIKKISIALAGIALATSLAGCAGGLGTDTTNVSYNAGKIYGEALTQEQLDVLGDGDIEAFCSMNGDLVDNAGTYDSFSAEDFTRGCVEGFEANQ